MGLPTKDVSQTVGFHGRQDTMQDNGKGRRDATLASSNRCLGGIVGLVGIVVVIVNHVVSFVLVDRHARFEMARCVFILCFRRRYCHGWSVVIVETLDVACGLAVINLIIGTTRGLESIQTGERTAQKDVGATICRQLVWWGWRKQFLPDGTVCVVRWCNKRHRMGGWRGIFLDLFTYGKSSTRCICMSDLVGVYIVFIGTVLFSSICLTKNDPKNLFRIKLSVTYHHNRTDN